MSARFFTPLLGLFLSLAPLAPNATADDKPPLKLLIVDGQNNHNWRVLTPFLDKLLTNSHRFTVDVATSPDKGASSAAWDSFRPDFAAYDVVLSNYNGEPWPAPVEQALEKYVREGGGLVIVHAANNSFPDWKAFNQMIGLGWRDADYGDRLTIDDHGHTVRTPAGEGPGAGHGPQHAYIIKSRDPAHPIMNGLPDEWLHAKDELYHGQRGPAQNMHILATAYSAADYKGTLTNEPLVWTIPYGKGRVFTNLLGHNMGEETTAPECVGFQTLLLRGAEWAAGSEVTTPVPENFPTTTDTSLATP